ncbi:uracil-DNA glycosylase [Parachlamydia sp. AcF125]|uniref:uracil-DNA glycosylase n=1 Tax=Parachlamydia sp. AcF125 TaxID=2795736 RepID=UPI001BC8ED46|nr:uracil-DNA glycosylase [Parachlamydia sp. AcF125]MBS4167802.1 Uracil-DNA glycosylase [Parachlamydia sp. AcF125]
MQVMQPHFSVLPFEIESSWQKALEEELKKSYLLELAVFLEKERAQGAQIYPPKNLVFNALWNTPFDQVKVVIIGQDPYHGQGQAHGLSFSVPEGITQPPSLKNIFKELSDDLGVSPPSHGCLLHWAKQGVLLLNATLTVRKGEPMSHEGRGWEQFTDAVVKALLMQKRPLVFILWGRWAQKKWEHFKSLQDPNLHLVLTAAHPSPYSANQGFFGCRHFSKTNQWLEKHHLTPIDWKIV